METTISLPLHLHASLAALLEPQVLEDDLDELLKLHIRLKLEDSSKEIPYDLLRRISQWAQAPEGKEKLKERRIDPADYSMIAMLAGTTTAPSAKLAPWKPPLTPEQQAIVKAKERKAISALINAFLSVIGVGVAAWWAAGSIGMRQDYKALLSVFGAILVAATEAILYWIWTWRYDKALKSTQTRVAKVKKDKPSVDEKADNSASSTSTATPQVEHARKRKKEKGGTTEKST